MSVVFDAKIKEHTKNVCPYFFVLTGPWMEVKVLLQNVLCFLALQCDFFAHTLFCYLCKSSFNFNQVSPKCLTTWTSVKAKTIARWFLVFSQELSCYCAEAVWSHTLIRLVWCVRCALCTDGIKTGKIVGTLWLVSIIGSLLVGSKYFATVITQSNIMWVTRQ